MFQRKNKVTPEGEDSNEKKLKRKSSKAVARPIGGEWKREKGDWVYKPVGVEKLVTSAAEPSSSSDGFAAKFRKMNYRCGVR